MRFASNASSVSASASDTGLWAWASCPEATAASSRAATPTASGVDAGEGFGATTSPVVAEGCVIASGPGGVIVRSEAMAGGDDGDDGDASCSTVVASDGPAAGPL